MDPRGELVRIDESGVAHPLNKQTQQQLRTHQGVHRLLRSPAGVVLLRRVRASAGAAEKADAPEVDDETSRVRMAGEVTEPGVVRDLTALIAQSGWRGELVVIEGVMVRSIFLDGGNVVAGASNVFAERVGAIMQKFGALTDAQVKLVLANIDPGRRFGEAALDLGLLTHEQLFQLMRRQLEEVFYGAMRVEQGTFFFVDGFDDARLPSRHHVSAKGLLLEGARRMGDCRMFREWVPSSAAVPTPIAGRAASPSDIALATVFGACDGVRSIEAIARECGVSEFDVTHAVFQLMQAGYVALAAVAASGGSGEGTIVATFNEVLVVVMAAVDARGAGGQLRAHLTVYASGAAEYAALFAGAGPAHDGSLHVARVLENARQLAQKSGGRTSAAILSSWLYEYAVFALFTASTQLAKGDEATLVRKVSDGVSRLAPAPAIHRAPPSLAPGKPFAAPVGEKATIGRAMPRLPKTTHEVVAAIGREDPRVEPVSGRSVTLRGISDRPPAPPRPGAPSTSARGGPPPRPAAPAVVRAHQARASTLIGVCDAPEGTATSKGGGTAAEETNAADGSVTPLTVASEGAPERLSQRLRPAAMPPLPAGRSERGSRGAIVAAKDPNVSPAVLASSEARDVAPVMATSAAAAVAPAADLSAASPGKSAVAIPSYVAGLALVAVVVGSVLGVRALRSTRGVGSHAEAALLSGASSANAGSAGNAGNTANAAKEREDATAARRTDDGSANARAAKVTPANVRPKSSPPHTATAPTAGRAAAPASSTGVLMTASAPAGFRVFYDGRMLGNTPGSFTVPCGVHIVKLGSAAAPRSMNIPCGGEISLAAK